MTPNPVRVWRAAAGYGGRVLADLVPVLACPVCGGGMVGEQEDERVRRVRCASGHSYDVARQGHVTLLAGAHRHAGDTAAMVAHRIAFLAAGHYSPIAAAVAELAAAAGATGVLLDIGGGPGWYAARTLDALPARVGITLDVSTAAARRAARAHPRLASVVADGTAGYPLRSGSVAVATCAFAPRNGPEIARVLAPGGRLVVVTPTPAHLAQVRGPLGLLAVGANKQARLAAGLPGLVAMERQEVRRELCLDRADLAHLALMGPSAFHLDPADLGARIAALPERIAVSLDVVAQAYTAT